MASFPCKPRYVLLAILAHGLLLWAVAGQRSSPPRLLTPALQPVMEISLAPEPAAPAPPIPAPPIKVPPPVLARDIPEAPPPVKEPAPLPAEPKAPPVTEPEPPSPVQQVAQPKPVEVGKTAAKPVKRLHKPAPQKTAPAPPAPPAPVKESATAAASRVPDQTPRVPAVTQPVFDAAYLNNPPPDYPRLARRAHQQGTVMLNVLVTVGGGAGEVNIAQSSGSDALDDAARQAVKRWRFIPAKRGGEPVAGWVRVPVVFRLDG
ncbi:energy transducer TonB [Sodalis ligni]|uniref:energy transducer TonB n=1 Tax=Sodalis ligni TaxID=2697027 RepID=UPI00193F1454|nr:energy transducer TonB [Sodalis ligni]QWA11324.1 energy transducer TonB [Sodalis ligni]